MRWAAECSGVQIGIYVMQCILDRFLRRTLRNVLVRGSHSVHLIYSWRLIFSGWMQWSQDGCLCRAVRNVLVRVSRSLYCIVGDWYMIECSGVWMGNCVVQWSLDGHVCRAVHDVLVCEWHSFIYYMVGDWCMRFGKRLSAGSLDTYSCDAVRDSHNWRLTIVRDVHSRWLI